jgi:hypothetical protein
VEANSTGGQGSRGAVVPSDDDHDLEFFQVFENVYLFNYSSNSRGKPNEFIRNWLGNSASETQQTEREKNFCPAGY